MVHWLKLGSIHSEIFYISITVRYLYYYCCYYGTTTNYGTNTTVLQFTITIILSQKTNKLKQQATTPLISSSLQPYVRSSTASVNTKGKRKRGEAEGASGQGTGRAGVGEGGREGRGGGVGSLEVANSRPPSTCHKGPSLCNWMP